MDFLCFNIKGSKVAINIIDVYKLVDNLELTFFSNREQKSIYLIKDRGLLIPVFDVDNDFNVKDKSIVLINSKEIFGIFVDSIDDIFRHKVPEGYLLMTKEEFKTLVKNGRDERASEIELF